MSITGMAKSVFVRFWTPH